MYVKSTVIVCVALMKEFLYSDPDIKNTFKGSTRSTLNIEIGNAEPISGFRSKIDCDKTCGQKSWCNAISWESETKTCHGFTRILEYLYLPSLLTAQFYTCDKDVCLGDGYTNSSGMCVKFFSDMADITWYEAEAFCISEGGRLVVIDTMDKYNFIVSEISLTADNNWWVGAQKVDGVWTWSTGEPLSGDLYVHNNQPDIAFCLGFYLNGLDDHGCYGQEKPICEK